MNIDYMDLISAPAIFVFAVIVCTVFFLSSMVQRSDYLDRRKLCERRTDGWAEYDRCMSEYSGGCSVTLKKRAKGADQ
jgi:hypothetical protein